MKTAKVLVVDLDNTLIKCDIMIRSIVILLRKNPFYAFFVLFYFLRGKVYLKQFLLRKIKLDVRVLNYNQHILDYIKKRKKNGDSIILATASCQYYADEIKKHLAPLFDKAYGSSATFNLSAHNKAKKLSVYHGVGGFDYMGDSRRDISVWRVSNLAILVGVSRGVLKKTAQFNRLIL